MLRDDISDCDITARSRCGKHISARFDLVGDDAVIRPVKLLHAVNTDHIRTGTLDIGAHRIQQICHVHHMGLFRNIFQDRASLCKTGGKHHIYSSAYGNLIKINTRPYKPLGIYNDHTVLDAPYRAKCTEAL